MQHVMQRIHDDENSVFWAKKTTICNAKWGFGDKRG